MKDNNQNNEEENRPSFKLFTTKEEYDAIFQEILNLSDNLPKDEIKRLIQKKFDFSFNFGLPGPKSNPEGDFIFYRARVVSPGDKVDENKVSEYYYPPDTSKIKLGRCNLKGEQVFYGSADSFTPFHEVSEQIKPGESIVYLSKWRFTPPNEDYIGKSGETDPTFPL